METYQMLPYQLGKYPCSVPIWKPHQNLTNPLGMVIISNPYSESSFFFKEGSVRQLAQSIMSLSRRRLAESPPFWPTYRNWTSGNLPLLLQLLNTTAELHWAHSHPCCWCSREKTLSAQQHLYISPRMQLGGIHTHAFLPISNPLTDPAISIS